MDMSPLLATMVAIGYVVLVYGFLSTWGRYRLGQAHRKNPLEAASHGLLSMAMMGQTALLVFFEPSTIMATLLLAHIIGIAIANTLVMIFLESKRGQLGGEYYLHTQIHYFFWIVNGLTFAYYAPLFMNVLAGASVPHLPVLRPHEAIHWSVWLLFFLGTVRTGIMVYFAAYALTHKAEPDARYHLDPTTRILSLKFYRTP